MIRKEYLKYVTPILLFFLMLIDAHLTKSFETWTSNVYFPVLICYYLRLCLPFLIFLNVIY